MRYLLLCLTLALAGLLSAQSFSDAKALYYRGVEGDKAASRESTRLFERLAAEKGNDAVITAYLASNRLLESGRTFALWNKNKLAKEGILGLDRAVSMAPDNVEVRFIRAMSTADLPGFFSRQEQSDADFEWLSTRVTAAAKAGHLEPRFAAAALYRYGLVLERKADKARAAAAWKQAVAVAPESKGATAAAAKLR